MKKIVLMVAFSVLSLAPQISQAQYRYVPGVRVMAAPPALRHEVVPPAPSPRHQWINGHWTWRGNAHFWAGGHWTVPPGYGYVWEPARWENVDGAWMFYEGHWRAGAQPDPAQAYQPEAPPVDEVVTETQPPASIEEIRPAQPFAASIWIPGYWHWSGHHHMWVAGRWSSRPSGYNWEPHRWEHRQDGRWVHHQGYWRR